MILTRVVGLLLLVLCEELLRLRPLELVVRVLLLSVKTVRVYVLLVFVVICEDLVALLDIR